MNNIKYLPLIIEVYTCTRHSYVYMLGAKRGFGQSMDGTAHKRGPVLCATIHGLSAHSLDRADRRAQSVDSGNLWIELKEAWIRHSCGSFTKGARSKYSRAVLCTRG